MGLEMMSSFQRRFDYLSWPDAAKALAGEGATLVWPFGACEQHGPHLPLATDNLFAERLLTKILNELDPDLPIWMLPSQSLGFSPEHQAFPGTISLSSETLIKLVMEVGKQLSEFGVKRLIFFNAHGGQIGLLQAAARQLKAVCPEMAIFPCFVWSGIEQLKELIPGKELEQGLHAGLVETSLMMKLAPELVGPERPVGGEQFSEKPQDPPQGWSLEGPAPCAWMTKDLSENGVIGDCRNANLTLGTNIERVLVDHWICLLTNLMRSNWPLLKKPDSQQINTV